MQDEATPHLTAMERAVLELRASGAAAKAIAAELECSEETVKTHLKSLHRKLRVSSVGELIARARSLGLLP
jgi:DNA-binding CsgD family transcriptional regulator